LAYYVSRLNIACQLSSSDAAETWNMENLIIQQMSNNILKPKLVKET